MAGKNARRQRRQEEREHMLAAYERRPRKLAVNRKSYRPVHKNRRLPEGMSEVITNVAQPLLDEHCKTPEDMRRMLGLVIAAWNVTLLPEEDQDKWRDDLVESVFGRKILGIIPLGASREARNMFKWICEVVAQRRQELYPNLGHFITDFATAQNEARIDLTVAYSLGIAPDIRKG